MARRTLKPKARTTQPKQPEQPGQPEQPEHLRIANEMAGKAGGKWWWVWVLGRPNPLNLGRRPHYFLGRLEGDEEKVKKLARKNWPQHIGNMKLEAYPD